MVTIPLEEYTNLVAAKDELDALHAAGVDNWDFYYDALRDSGLGDNDEEEED